LSDFVWQREMGFLKQPFLMPMPLEVVGTNFSSLPSQDFKCNRGVLFNLIGSDKNSNYKNIKTINIVF